MVAINSVLLRKWNILYALLKVILFTFLFHGLYIGVSFSDDKEYPRFVPAGGEVRAFVNEILQKEMPSQLETFKDTFKGDLEKYFKIVCLIYV